MLDLFTADLTRTLPPPLLADTGMRTLAEVIAAQWHKTLQALPQTILYARIDTLAEDVLDVLAYDLHADWYDLTAPPDVKRTLLRESVHVHQRMGTKWAVETMAQAYFGSGAVSEWFEYGGRPYYFKIRVEDKNTKGLGLGRFLSLLEGVKRKSAWLETLEFWYHIPVPMAFVGVDAAVRGGISLFGTDIAYFDGLHCFDGTRGFYARLLRGTRTPLLTICSRVPWQLDGGAAVGTAGAAQSNAAAGVTTVATRGGACLFGIVGAYFDGALQFDGNVLFAPSVAHGPHGVDIGAAFRQRAAMRLRGTVGSYARLAAVPLVKTQQHMSVALRAGSTAQAVDAGSAGQLDVASTVSATATEDTMRRADGAVCFDGTRRWNADIIRYQL